MLTANATENRCNRQPMQQTTKMQHNYQQARTAGKQNGTQLQQQTTNTNNTQGNIHLIQLQQQQHHQTTDNTIINQPSIAINSFHAAAAASKQPDNTKEQPLSTQQSPDMRNTSENLIDAPPL